MVVNQPALRLVDWVVLEPGRFVEVIIEGWLVHDDEVGALIDRLFDYLVACQKGCDDPGYWLVRIAGLNGVDGIVRWVVGRRGERHVDDLLNGWWCAQMICSSCCPKGSAEPIIAPLFRVPCVFSSFVRAILRANLPPTRPR